MNTHWKLQTASQWTLTCCEGSDIIYGIVVVIVMNEGADVQITWVDFKYQNISLDVGRLHQVLLYGNLNYVIIWCASKNILSSKQLESNNSWDWSTSVGIMKKANASHKLSDFLLILTWYFCNFQHSVCQLLLHSCIIKCT